MTPVAEDDKQAPGAVPRVFEEFISQLRAGTERLEALARPGGRSPLGPDAMALPGARMLTPIAEWSRAWADLEHRLLPGRPGQEPP